jgi:hypothetical protein
LALLTGTDFFTAEVLTLHGLVTYYVRFFIHLESRRVDTAGITVRPDEPWMKQIARNATMEGWGVLRDCRYLLHDRDTKFTRSFRAVIASGRVEPLFTSFRHGGFTEAADSDLTDAEMRAQGRHKSAKVLPRYAKRTMKQVAEGARKRRAAREQTIDILSECQKPACQNDEKGGA